MMDKRITWIDGLKGYACLVVLFGHSVACIFPSMFFGDSYQAHSVIERIVHMSPLNIIIASGQMNGLFFFLSGMIIVKKYITNNLIDRIVTKYIKFIPMVFGGGITAYIVMRMHLIYHIKLKDFSYATNYVQWANEFEPSLIGEHSVLKDIFITTFLDSSKYDSPLWFLAVLFWGTIIVESIAKNVSSKRIKTLIWLMLYLLVTNMEQVDWRIPYLGYIFMGAAIGNYDYFNSQNLKVPRWLPIVLFSISLYITAPSEYIGFYKPLSYFSILGMHLKVIGLILLVKSISISKDLQKLFDLRVSQWLNRYSLGIYVFHWSFVISLSCGATYILNVIHNINYMVSGLIGIVLGLLGTVLCSVVYTEDVYKPVSRLFSTIISITRNKLREICDER